MNSVLSNTWKGRIRQAEATLTSPSSIERQLRKALADTVSALAEAVHHVEDAYGQLREAREEIDVQRAAFDELFSILPGAALITTADGKILNSNPAAATLLNVSSRYLADKSLLLFFGGRDQWIATLGRMNVADCPLREMAVLRPRERAPRDMLVCVTMRQNGTLLWLILPPGSSNGRSPNGVEGA